MQTRIRQLGLVGIVTLSFVVILPCTALAESGNSEVGTWKLNLAKSKFVQGVAPKSHTITIEASGSGITTVMDTVESDGRVRHFEATQDYDGKEELRRATDGKPIPNGDVVALTRLDAHTTTTVYKQDKKVTITRRSVVSADGKTMTITTTGMNALGEPLNSVAVYDKQ